MTVTRDCHEPELIAALDLGALTLAVPITQLHSLRPALDLEPSRSGDALIGSIRIGSIAVPIFHYDSVLRPSRQVPVDYRVCAILADGDRVLGLLCKHAEAVSLKALRQEGVPDCLRAPASPVDSLLIGTERVLCRTNTRAMFRYANDATWAHA